MTQKRNKLQIIKKLTPVIMIIGFIFFKIQDLFLPYFWDEAWSYMPAINAMVKKGISLLPNSIPPELYRGHPLFFYFIASVWIKLFGSEIWITKLFPLIITSGLLYTVYLFTKKTFDNQIALLSLFILMIQSVIFAQATFILPEILLAFFTFLIIKNFIEKKYINTMLLLLLALFTKESGIVIWFTVVFFEVIQIVKSPDRKYKNLFYLLVPLFTISIFFIVQKWMVGWFFFPNHLAFINPSAFLDRLNGYSSYLFIYMGRNILSIAGLGSLIYLLIRNNKELSEKKKILYIFSFFIISYILFSSMNFYSPRYLLSILPFVVIMWVFFIKSVLKKYHASITLVVFAIIIINNLYFTVHKRGGNDHSLGYRDLIQVQQKMISYCEDEMLFDENIYTQFLMNHYMTNKSSGYLKGTRTFDNIKGTVAPDTRYAIFSTDELDKVKYEEIKANNKLLKRFEQNRCWSEIYQLNKK